MRKIVVEERKSVPDNFPAQERFSQQKKKSEENIFQQFHGIISVEKYRVRANRHTQSRFYYNKEGIYCAEREI